MDNSFLHTKQAGLTITYKNLEVIFVYKKQASRMNVPVLRRRKLQDSWLVLMVTEQMWDYFRSI